MARQTKQICQTSFTKQSWGYPKLSDRTLVKKNWSNYVIPIVLVAGVIYLANGSGVGAVVGAGFGAGATSFLALKWLKSVHLGLGLVFLVRAILFLIFFCQLLAFLHLKFFMITPLTTVEATKYLLFPLDPSSTKKYAEV